ncbi:MAG: hypothetical protein HOV94_35690, partial [Saccharothrix sp.]|nr:hypothetical protein [Saccharothrix sp.]
AAKQRIVADGLLLADRVPEVHPTIRVADAPDLARARTAYSLLDRLATWLPVAALVLLVGGVAVARRRRRTLLAAGLGVAAGMVLLAVALAVARAVLVGKAQPDDADATAAAFDVVVRLLRDGLRVVLVLGLAVALVAFLSGPSTPATGIRRAATGAVRALRAKGADAGWRTGRVGTWVHTYRGVLRGAAFAIAALVFVFLDQPGVTAVVVLGAALVLCLVVIRLFDRAPVG